MCIRDRENLMANGAAGDEEEFMMVIAEAGGDDYEDCLLYTSPS